MSELIIEGMSHDFGEKRIIRCDYTVFKKGITTGIIGRNGCGKTTLFKLMFGILKADYKRQLYKGEVVSKLFMIPGAVAFLPQDSFLPKYIKVNKFLKIAKLSREKENILRKRFSHLLNHRIVNLSGGERRMLEIQYIFALERDFLLIDEPFVGLEPKAIAEIKQLIRQSSSGILVSSHSYRDLTSELDEIFILKQGKLIKVDSEEELRRLGYLPLLNSRREIINAD